LLKRKTPLKTSKSSKRGGQLKVSFEQKGEGFGNIWLTGAAQKVFEGSIEI
jgi:predicted PhzF superfamily epimerase YddE/YHI9